MMNVGMPGFGIKDILGPDSEVKTMEEYQAWYKASRLAEEKLKAPMPGMELNPIK